MRTQLLAERRAKRGVPYQQQTSFTPSSVFLPTNDKGLKLKRDSWTISKTKLATFSPLPAFTPPSTKYSPDYFKSSKIERCKGGTISPLPANHSKHLSPLSSTPGATSPALCNNRLLNGTSKYLQQVYDEIEADARAETAELQRLINMEKQLQSQVKAASVAESNDDADEHGNEQQNAAAPGTGLTPPKTTRRIKKNNRLEPWTRLPQRETALLEKQHLETPSPGVYDVYKDRWTAPVKGGVINSTLERFQTSAQALVTPGPGTYTPQTAPTTNTKGTHFCLQTGARCQWGDPKEGFYPGPGAYEMSSSFPSRVQPISTRAASVLADRIPLDFDEPTPDLLADIRFIRSTAEDIARFKLRQH